MKRELLSKAFGGIDEGYILEAYRSVPGDASGASERIVHMKKKRIITFALAAVLMLALGISAHAVWGVPRYVATHSMPLVAEYTDLSALPTIEKRVGYPVTVPERFSNGYSFARLRVDGQAVIGESNEVLKEYYVVNATYSRVGAPELTLHLSPVPNYEGAGKAPAPSEQRTVSGVTVNLNLDHYKVVPEDYEKTEDDLAREAAGHYYVSFGSDAVEEYEIAFAGFELDGVEYLLMDMAADGGSFDTLTLMAGEVIAAHR